MAEGGSVRVKDKFLSICRVFAYPSMVVLVFTETQIVETQTFLFFSSSDINRWWFRWWQLWAASSPACWWPSNGTQFVLLISCPCKLADCMLPLFRNFIGDRFYGNFCASRREDGMPCLSWSWLWRILLLLKWGLISISEFPDSLPNSVLTLYIILPVPTNGLRFLSTLFSVILKHHFFLAPFRWL